MSPDCGNAVGARLSLHYFSWRTSLGLAAEIRRAMISGGLLIARVNSTRDTNHGAVGHPEIEPNFYNVEGFSKRFFDRQSVLDLFAGWKIEAMEERAIMRYEKAEMDLGAVPPCRLASPAHQPLSRPGDQSLMPLRSSSDRGRFSAGDPDAMHLLDLSAVRRALGVRNPQDCPSGVRTRSGDGVSLG